VTPRAGPIDVLVTGAAGFVGSALVERLDARGASVVGADLRPASGIEPIDVTDRASAASLVARLRPRTIVHAAARVDDRGSPALFERVNVEGTRHMLAAAERHSVRRFVHVSSIAALGIEPVERLDETSPLRTNEGSPYFDTKARSEAVAREAFGRGAFEGVVVRPGDVYGAASVPWVLRPLDLMRRGMPLLVDRGRGLIAHCAIDHLVDALVGAVERPEAAGGIYIVHDGSDTTTYARYFETLARSVGHSSRLRSLRRSFALALARAAETLGPRVGLEPPFTRAAIRYVCRRATYSIEAARRDLGFTPRISLDEGLADVAPTLRAG
jgi:nucleoside-diphosphate-sugar epimerase